MGWVGVEDGGRLGREPAPLALPDPMGPTEVAEPGAEEADCAAGLLAGSEGGVDIWFCGGTALCAPGWFMPTGPEQSPGLDPGNWPGGRYWFCNCVAAG